MYRSCTLFPVRARFSIPSPAVVSAQSSPVAFQSPVRKNQHLLALLLAFRLYLVGHFERRLPCSPSLSFYRYFLLHFCVSGGYLSCQCICCLSFPLCLVCSCCSLKKFSVQCALYLCYCCSLKKFSVQCALSGGISLLGSFGSNQ